MSSPRRRSALDDLDLRAVAPADRDGVRDRWTRDWIDQRFDLAKAPLWRTGRIRTESSDALMVVFHHAIFDGWSLGVWLRELYVLLAGRGLPQAPAIAFADVAHWQRQWLDGDEAREQLAAWQATLNGAPVLDLPLDRPRPARKRFGGDVVPVVLSPAVSQALESEARAQGATPFMALLALWGALLGRMAGQHDLIVGTGVANRDRAETHGVLGFFANMVSLRLNVGGPGVGGPSFRQLLRQARRVAGEAFARQAVPFEAVVEALAPRYDPSRNPLFDVALTFEEGGGAADDPPWSVSALATSSAKFDLSLDLRRTVDGRGTRIDGVLEYATALFDAETARALAARFSRLAACATEAPDHPLASFDLGTQEEREAIASWNDTTSDFPRDRGIAELFAEQAARTPDAIAVEAATGIAGVANPAEGWTYSELAVRARRLGHHLRRLGVGPEVGVAVAMPRGVARVLAFLGVVEAGGFFVPVDIDAPSARARAMLDDVDARILITGDGAAAPLGDDFGDAFEVVDLERDAARIAGMPAGPIPSGAGPDNLLYVMFTSGSTGRPKGVATTHRNVARLILGNGFARLAGERVLQLAPAAFDASTLEIWGPLLTGGRLVVYPPQPPSLEHLGAVLRASGVTTLWLTSGLFHEMVDQQLAPLLELRQLLSGGDVLSAHHVERFCAAAEGHVTLINGYGPTEGTTFATTHAMAGPVGVASTVPIGRPIADTRAHVLDSWMRPGSDGRGGRALPGRRRAGTRLLRACRGNRRTLRSGARGPRRGERCAPLPYRRPCTVASRRCARVLRPRRPPGQAAWLSHRACGDRAGPRRAPDRSRRRGGGARDRRRRQALGRLCRADVGRRVGGRRSVVASVSRRTAAALHGAECLRRARGLAVDEQWEARPWCLAGARRPGAPRAESFGAGSEGGSAAVRHRSDPGRAVARRPGGAGGRPARQLLRPRWSLASRDPSRLPAARSVRCRDPGGCALRVGRSRRHGGADRSASRADGGPRRAAGRGRRRAPGPGRVRPGAALGSRSSGSRCGGLQHPCGDRLARAARRGSLEPGLDRAGGPSWCPADPFRGRGRRAAASDLGAFRGGNRGLRPRSRGRSSTGLGLPRLRPGSRPLVASRADSRGRNAPPTGVGAPPRDRRRLESGSSDRRAGGCLCGLRSVGGLDADAASGDPEHRPRCMAAPLGGRRVVGTAARCLARRARRGHRARPADRPAPSERAVVGWRAGRDPAGQPVVDGTRSARPSARGDAVHGRAGSVSGVALPVVGNPPIRHRYTRRRTRPRGVGKCGRVLRQHPRVGHAGRSDVLVRRSGGGGTTHGARGIRSPERSLRAVDRSCRSGARSCPPAGLPDHVRAAGNRRRRSSRTVFA